MKGRSTDHRLFSGSAITRAQPKFEVVSIIEAGGGLSRYNAARRRLPCSSRHQCFENLSAERLSGWSDDEECEKQALMKRIFYSAVRHTSSMWYDYVDSFTMIYPKGSDTAEGISADVNSRSIDQVRNIYCM